MTSNPAKPVRVSYLTEQTSHHPPVSAFYISCPEKGLRARGFDQITAKFTGTSIKVMPGEHNLGIFITVERRDDETYQLTHPAAHVGGLFRGALSVTVGDMAYITCPQTKLKAILHYFDEGWLGRSTNKVEGIIFRYDPENDDKQRIKDVPDEDILVRLGGAWRERIMFTMGPKPVVCFPSPVSDHNPRSVYTLLTKSLTGFPPRRKANHNNRHSPPLRRAEANPPGGPAARARIPAPLGWCHQGDPLKTVLQGHNAQARA
jgi:hypothetical protein